MRQNCSLKIWVCDRSDQTISFTGDCLSQGKICVFSICKFSANVVFTFETVTRLLGVIWSSEEAHTVDALAVRGDERRGSLRKASGSRQTDFDPEVSEWGNPAIIRWLSCTEYIGARSEPGELKHLSTLRKRNQPRFP